MFSEDKYYRRFKQIRNRFRKFTYASLIAGCLEYLLDNNVSKVDYIQRHPWLVLLFIKWILIDDNYPNSRGTPATKGDLLNLLQSMRDMNEILRLPDEYEHHSLWLRNVAYQQLPYQSDFGYRHLSRQMILFSDLAKTHSFNKAFKKNTGVSVNDFLELSWLLMVKFVSGKEKLLTEEWFDSVKDEYSSEVIKNYLKAISIEIDEAQRVLRENDNGRRRSSEQYEFTPFVQFPLLQTDYGYLITEKNILYRCIEHAVYDRLRKWNAGRFMDKFGKVFERYTETVLKYGELEYTPEKTIKATLGDEGNQIDFIVHEDESNVFIDAKGVEMNYQGRVTHSVSLLKDKTKESVLKAIIQAHDVIRKLNEGAASSIPNYDCNYLLVVTFKDFYLGSGQNYYENIAQTAMDEIYEKYIDSPVIPPDNMYFITIDDLEFACSMIKDNKISLSNILENAKKADKDPMSRKFDFIQHLQSMGFEINSPQYLKDKKDEIFDKIKGMMGAP